MKNKILLIRPENIYNYNNYPPLNLISLASALKARGFEVKIINCALYHNAFSVIREELESSLLAGITLLTSEVPGAYRIAEFIKTNSDVPVVAGGWHATLFAEQMADSEYIDYVITGEGERHIVELVERQRGNLPPAERIFGRQILNLEELDFPDYQLDENIEHFINSDLTDKFSEYVKRPIRWLPYESSRGCPSKCTFCINVVTGNNIYRKKSADKVIAEVTEIIKRFRLNHLKFIDDNFFVDIERTRKICEGIIRNNLNISWDAECRVDYFNDRMLNGEALSLAKRSGLVQLTLGIESGSRHTLALMKKDISPEDGEYAVKRLNKYGIIARSSLIIEIPGETKADIKKTVKFVNRLRRYPNFTCGVQVFRPYPKCELTEQLVSEGILSEPKSFRQWRDTEIIKLYVEAQYARPWRVYNSYSDRAAHYLTVESGVALRGYQIESALGRWINRIFVILARLRNRMSCYALPLDRTLYRKFFARIYRKKERSKKIV